MQSGKDKVYKKVVTSMNSGKGEAENMACTQYVVFTIRFVTSM